MDIMAVVAVNYRNFLGKDYDWIIKHVERQVAAKLVICWTDTQWTGDQFRVGMVSFAKDFKRGPNSSLPA